MACFLRLAEIDALSQEESQERIPPAVFAGESSSNFIRAPTESHMKYLQLALLVTGSGFGGTIVSDVFSGGSSQAVNGAFAVSWTQTVTYTDVTVGANLGAPSIQATSTGMAYLVDQIGQGTTVADELALPFSISITGDTAINEMTTLFTGLTLGPGTYYLVVLPSSFGQSDSLDWHDVAPPHQTLGSGVTQNASLQASSPSGFGPANTFSSTSINPIFRVTGNLVPVATPEPASLLLGAAGLTAILLRRRRAQGPSPAPRRPS